MFLFSIKSKVNRRSKVSEKFHNVGGAYVSCFISFKDFEAAEKLAKLLIREQGWIPEKALKPGHCRSVRCEGRRTNSITLKLSNMAIA
jgi:hypothetical protein